MAADHRDQRMDRRTGREADVDAEPTWRHVWDLVCADALRYVYFETGADVLRPRSFLSAFVRNPGLQASVIHRVYRKLTLRRRPGVAHRIGTIALLLVRKRHEALHGINISARAQLGPGVYIAHAHGIVLGAVRTGRNCNIGQGVTIGSNGPARRSGAPTLGARVQVGPGAMVFGPVELGDDVLVGANSVVTRPVPPRGVAVGVPAVVRSARGSFELIRYPGWESDPERSRSQELARPEAPTTAG
jgi:serine O-acetyltransferase